MKQIVVIHGGKVFANYEKYLHSLRTREVTKEKFRPYQDWAYTLEKELGEGYEVLAPRMPNGFNAVYEEWKIWFERIVPFLEEAILVGHSLGGIFLAKYLAENIFAKKLRAVILISAPFADLDTERVIGSFTLPKSLDNIAKQVSKIYLIHSKDDPIVPFREVEAYKKALPSAVDVVFEDRGHFQQDIFPELQELIKTLYNS